MKKILKYIILLIVVYLVVELFVALLTKTYYTEMKNYNILVESPKIEITESKVSKNKGYIQGTVTNNTEGLMKNTKIKFDFYNEQGKFVGTEYKIEEILNVGEKVKFDIKYEYKNVAEIRISIIKGE